MPDLAPADIAGPMALVCHDAGAANLAIAWVQTDVTVTIQPFMAGPALALWQAAFPERPVHDSLESALDGAVTLISGTGWATTIEHDARVEAARRGMLSYAVLDHWTNYAARFERGGRTCLPNGLIVSDRWARDLAQQIFSSIPVFQWPNRYLEAQLTEIAPVPKTGDVLYVCEPARNDWGRNIAGEFQAIDFFLLNRGLLGVAGSCRIRLRPHPSEEVGKYDALVAANGYLAIDDSPTLASSINKSELVVGMNSAAMVVALASGRRVASCLPSWAPACVLPHDGIIHLRELVAT
jgi:hypothetical protein